MSIRFKKFCFSSDGLTLPELLVSTAILFWVFAAVVISFMRSIELNEISRSTSLALLAAQSKLAAIESTTFGQIPAAFHNTTFTSPDLNGLGVVTINSTTNPDLLGATVTFCWQQKNGRVMGEDLDLNGQLDSGEDKNSNGVLDSPVTLYTEIYKE